MLLAGYKNQAAQQQYMNYVRNQERYFSGSGQGNANGGGRMVFLFIAALFIAVL